MLLKDTRADAVIADKAYDAQARVIEPLLQAGKTVVIPSRRTRKQPRTYDPHLYQARHLIENFFARLKQYRVAGVNYLGRRVASRRNVTRPLVVVWSSFSVVWPAGREAPAPFGPDGGWLCVQTSAGTASALRRPPSTSSVTRALRQAFTRRCSVRSCALPS